MSVLLKKIEIIKLSNPDDITIVEDEENLNVKLSLQGKGSTMQITLKNAYKKYIADGSFKFKVDDTVKLYLKYTDDVTETLTDDDLIMSSSITEVGYSLEETKTNISLNCTDKTYLMLNKLWAFNYKKSLGLSAPEIIINLIDSNTTEGKGVKGSVSANLKSNGGYIQDTRTISGSEFGTSFPSPIVMAKVYKPIYEWISNLSQIDKTNSASELDTDTGTTGCNRPMIFYIDENNEAHWEYPGTTSANYEITAGTTELQGTDTLSHKVHSFNFRKATFDMVNMVIFNSGDDLNGSGVLSYWFDPNADATQLKPTYRPWTDLLKDILSKELVENSSKYSKSDTGSLLFHNKLKFNADYTDGGFKPIWADDSSDDLLTSDSELNTSLRDYGISEGKNKAQTLTSRTASPRYKGSMVVKGKKYNVGNLIKFNSELHGITNILIRITDVQHTINKNGWFTDLAVEEDPNEYNS